MIIRVDTIKGISTSDMITEKTENGTIWLLAKHNVNEAFVEKSTLRKLHKALTSLQTTHMLIYSNRYPACPCGSFPFGFVAKLWPMHREALIDDFNINHPSGNPNLLNRVTFWGTPLGAKRCKPTHLAFIQFCDI